jgi:hypothetical protein
MPRTELRCGDFITANLAALAAIDLNSENSRTDAPGFNVQATMLYGVACYDRSDCVCQCDRGAKAMWIGL